MPQPLRVLIVEDNSQDAELLMRELRRAGFDPYYQRVDTEAEYLIRLNANLDIILSDHQLPQFSGTRALDLLNQRQLEIPFIIVSGTIGEEAAVEAIKHGASDYLLKDRLTRLGPAVRQALEQYRMRKESAVAKAELHESDERFRQVVENIGEVFWMTSLDKTEMLYISPGYEKIWGRSRAALYANPREWLDAIHPDDAAAVHAALPKQVQGDYEQVYRILRPDGEIRFIRDRTFPVRNSRGVVYRTAGVAEDITAQRRAEEVRREADRRFRWLLENVELLAIILDKNGIVTFANDFLLRTTGWRREEVVNSNWFSKFVPEASPDAREVFSGDLESGTIPPHHENSIQTKAGKLREIVWRNTILRDAGGNIIGVASIGEDITERKWAEERLRQQAAMLDLAHDAIIVRDFHSDQIIFWNKGAERMYGWTAEKALEQRLGELVSLDPKAPVAVPEALSEKGEWFGEVRHLTKGGKKLIVNARATLVRDAAGKPKAVLSIHTDVTEQRRLEAQFLRAQRMESIGTLASGVAHDLNNILAPIMMSVPLLRQDLTKESREGIITTIEMSADRGAQIVKQVLTFGRGLEGERKPISVATAIRELEKIARETFPKGIRVEVDLAPDLWPILGDSIQIHQVLLNLCVNARDAMPNGGRLRLSASNREVDDNYAAMIPEISPGRHVLITAIDEGVGIPPEIIERIFDPFFTTKAVGQGTGLGLSTVLGIVKSHGGAVQVASEPDKGTTFQVYLPALAQDHAVPPAVPAAEAVPPGNGEWILVVDDESSVRGAALKVLSLHNYEVLCAADGTEALALFAKHSDEIAAVVTDLMMPFMDGAALIRALVKMKPGLPIAASTGLGEKAQLAEVRSLGVRAVIHKPYSAEALLRVIHDMLPVRRIGS
jgi:PAS domain S-box-containing protein